MLDTFQASTALNSPLACALPAAAQLPLHPRHQVAFAQAWDEIITDLRDRDLLTNADEANLKYAHLRWADDHQQAWLLLPRY